MNAPLKISQQKTDGRFQHQSNHSLACGHGLEDCQLTATMTVDLFDQYRPSYIKHSRSCDDVADVTDDVGCITPRWQLERRQPRRLDQLNEPGPATSDGIRTFQLTSQRPSIPCRSTGQTFYGGGGLGAVVRDDRADCLLLMSPMSLLMSCHLDVNSTPAAHIFNTFLHRKK